MLGGQTVASCWPRVEPDGIEPVQDTREVAPCLHRSAKRVRSFPVESCRILAAFAEDTPADRGDAPSAYRAPKGLRAQSGVTGLARREQSSHGDLPHMFGVENAFPESD